MAKKGNKRLDSGRPDMIAISCFAALPAIFFIPQSFVYSIPPTDEIITEEVLR